MKTLLHKNPFTRKRLMVFSSIAALVAGTVAPMSVQAAQLESRELTLEDSAASATTGHNYSFTIPTADDVAEIRFEYCNNNPFPGESCTAPSGLDVSSVTLDNQSGETGFSIDSTNTTTNEIVIDRTAEAVTADTAVEYDFGSADNPDSANAEFFVRMYTYSDDGSTLVDDGGLAFSTAETVDVTARVEENLVFCIYGSASDNCDNPGDTTVDLGVLEINNETTASHRAEVTTNALNGFTVQYAGTTLTHSNGSDTIEAITGTGEASNPSGGVEQFGMNISIANSPSTSASLDADYSGSNYAFVNNASVTDGGDNTADNTIASRSGAVDTNEFNIEYLGNVNTTTETGVYSTTVTYVATSTF